MFSPTPDEQVGREDRFENHRVDRLTITKEFQLSQSRHVAAGLSSQTARTFGPHLSESCTLQTV